MADQASIADDDLLAIIDYLAKTYSNEQAKWGVDLLAKAGIPEDATVK